MRVFLLFSLLSALATAQFPFEIVRVLPADDKLDAALPRTCDSTTPYVAIGKGIDMSISPAQSLCGVDTNKNGINEIGNCWVACDPAYYSSTVLSSIDTQVQIAMSTVTNALTGVITPLGATGISLASSTATCPFDDAVTIAPAAFTSSKTAFPNVEFVLFVTTRPTMKPLTDGTQPSFYQLALGRTCAVDNTSKRPTVGHLNVDPVKFANTTNPQQLLVPAIMNALGFHSRHFAAKNLLTTVFKSYQDAEKNAYMTNNTFAANVTYFTGPLATAAARNHFDCPALPGAELENGYPTPHLTYFDKYYVNGGYWAKNNYLEKRVFGPEAMTLGFRADSSFALSTISLSVMDDLGWYKVSYANAAPLAYGFKAGCDFANLPCSMTTCNFDPQFERARRAKDCQANPQFSYYFCKGPQNVCSYDLKAVAQCPNPLQWTSLPGSYRYFSLPGNGGASAEADLCPIPTYSPATSCANRTPTAKRGESNVNSACMMSSFLDEAPGANPVAADPTPACFTYKCLTQTTLAFKLSGSRSDYWFKCDDDDPKPPNVRDSSLPEVQGFILCPKVITLCRGTTVPDNTIVSITRVEPTTGPSTGGSKVTIFGANFPSPTSPSFRAFVGGVPVVSNSCTAQGNNGTELVCTTSPAANSTVETYSYVWVYDDTRKSDGGFLPMAFGFTLPQSPSPVPSPVPIKKEGKGFLKKSCWGIPCFTIPIIFFALTLPCLCYKIIRKKKPVELRKKIVTGENEDDGVQL